MHSISFRVQRTTTEAAFIKVPLTADLITEQPDGSGRLDVEKLMVRVVELGGAGDVVWEVESSTIAPHPTQTPPPGAE